MEVKGGERAGKGVSEERWQREKETRERVALMRVVGHVMGRSPCRAIVGRKAGRQAGGR